MKRQGFLLGLFSIGGQVLLLRELVSSLNGDELFIGTALFGWLVSIALGAYLGGKWARPRNPNRLFILGAVLLPVMVAVAKMSPLLVTSVTGEIVPFSKGAVISIVTMLPIGIISGWLFPLITCRVIYPASDAVAIVYLYEGIGAFVGGIFIFLLVIFNEATIVIAVAISFFVFTGLLATGRALKCAMVILGYILFIVFFLDFFWAADNLLEITKHSSYELKTGIYTPYGHHLIFERDESMVLIDDNNIEATYPDPETAENHFLVPFIYHPSAEKPIYVGCARFVAPSLSDRNLPGPVIEIDPRGRLYRLIMQYIPKRYPFAIRGRSTDGVRYFTSNSGHGEYDIIIINSGMPDNYISSRYFTAQFLRSVKTKMADSSVLAIPLAYDTDRYVTPETQDVLSIIHATLSAEFANVMVWPGTTTIFLVSNRVPLDLTYEEIIARLDENDIGGDYISEAYLFDRLSTMKVERLHSAISGVGPQNTVRKPILTHYQAMYRAKTHPTDEMVLSFILNRALWLSILPVGILVLFWMLYRAKNRPRGNALFLYFTAGVASLSLELISFYIYQTMAGSLYAELSLLIGAFMLGLAVGTYFAHKAGKGPLEFPALIILLVATVIFLTTWDKIGTDALLPFHALFLFVVAIATGTLFVAATNIYYGDEQQTNRGVGYAWEISGSALGALITMTVLLPLIGLTWLLLSLAGLISLALVGAAISQKSLRAY
jgi:hypothetical protein